MISEDISRDLRKKENVLPLKVTPIFVSGHSLMVLSFGKCGGQVTLTDSS